MITRMVKVQLVIFSILTMVTASAIVFIYADLPAKYGWWGQTYVTATFEDGAGIYKAGNVTYRGVGEMGEVTDIDLNPDGGVDVKFRYDSDLDVPANVRAEIHAVSAVGEFYVDLVPPAEPSSEKLQDGDHIPIERTSIPLPLAPVLDDVNTFLQAIDKGSMSAFMTEAADAFDQLGPNLRNLLTNAQKLVDEANINYQATTDFLRDIPPLFNTQVETAGNVRNWASQLDTFAQMLADVDPQFGQALDQAGDSAHTAAMLVNELANNPEAPAQSLTANLRTFSDLLTIYTPGLEQILLSYPQAMAKIQLLSRNPGFARLDLATTVGNPPGCGIGYPQNGDPLTSRNPFDVRDYPTIQDAYCKVQPEDPRSTRGGRNIPCFEPGTVGLRAATVEDCRNGGYNEAKVGTSNFLELPNPAQVVPQSATPTNAEVAVPVRTMTIGSWQNLLLPTV